MNKRYAFVTNRIISPRERNIPRPIRVARVWMNMGVRMSEFRETPPAERWDEHKRLVMGQANANKKAYQARVSRLIQAAENVQVDAVLLPACTFVHGCGIALSGYHLPTNSVLISGALYLSRKSPREYGIAARDGAIVGRFERNEIGKVDGANFTAFGAISSTIKRLTRFPEEEPKNLDDAPRAIASPILLLDAGHHPYSDHYRRHTLRVAVKAIRRRYNSSAAAVLASWQYVISKPSPSWCVPEELGRVLRLIDDGDILDIVEIDLT